MKYEEKKKMLQILTGVDLLTSGSKEPVALVQLVDLLKEIPAGTVYSQIERARVHGLITKGKSGGRYTVAITLAGYRLLEKESPPWESVKVEETTPLLSYEQAFRIVGELYINAGTTTYDERQQRESVVGSIASLLNK